MTYEDMIKERIDAYIKADLPLAQAVYDGELHECNCGYCGNSLTYKADNFCGECGCLLDWSEAE